MPPKTDTNARVLAALPAECTGVVVIASHLPFETCKAALFRLRAAGTIEGSDSRGWRQVADPERLPLERAWPMPVVLPEGVARTVVRKDLDKGGRPEVLRA